MLDDGRGVGLAGRHPHDDGLPLRRRHDVDRVLSVPVPAQDTGREDALVGDEAGVDGDDVVGPVLAQAGPADLVDGELDPGAPAEAVVVAGNGLDGHLDVELGDRRELLARPPWP